MRSLAILTLCVASLWAQPEIPFEASNPLKLPAEMNLGEAAGIALNSKGHMFVYNRGAHTALFEFDQTGRFLREIGKDLYGFSFAHVVKIDKDDNIWCVDEGSNMVIEFNPEGHVIMTLGRKGEPSEAPLPAARLRRRAPMLSTALPTSPGTPPATAISAMATIIRAWPKSTGRATG